ncbi:replication initiation protein RepC [Ochrobactrum sp. P20RRXII]|nr:replication initiation protein RepC [Ochrobactrum sp. P20RRXII]NIH77454.1 replication initiation protein RepC [Ochrobactrum sp. P20RRXII]
MARILRSWRRPDVAFEYESLSEPITRSELLKVATIAGKALALSAPARQVLKELTACYGNKLCEERAIVWPSNEYLVDATGLSERSVRLALAALCEANVIAAVRSPNGKRFAQFDPSGNIIRAYGFDLAPMWQQRTEFHNQSYLINEVRRGVAQAYDEITLCRKFINDGLVVLLETGSDVSDLTNALAALNRKTPSRRVFADPVDILPEWHDLRLQIEERITASDGTVCRHIDNNNDFNFCEQAFEEKLTAEPSLRECVETCADAADVTGPVTTENELVGRVVQLRGMCGLSEAAWDEAREKIGAVFAAKLFFYTVQMQARPKPGTKQIQNFGGYFRTLARMTAEGRFDLSAELRKMRRRE